MYTLNIIHFFHARGNRIKKKSTFKIENTSPHGLTSLSVFLSLPVICFYLGRIVEGCNRCCLGDHVGLTWGLSLDNWVLVAGVLGSRPRCRPARLTADPPLTRPSRVPSRKHPPTTSWLFCGARIHRIIDLAAYHNLWTAIRLLEKVEPWRRVPSFVV